MVTMDRILLLVVSGLLLPLCFESALGQANPELDKFWQMQRMQMKGRDVMNTLLSKHGLDYEQLAALVSNKKDMYQFLAEKFEEMMAGARVVETASGDHAYLLADEEEEERDRLISKTCLDHIRMGLRDLDSGVYYARRMAASFGAFPTESAEFSWQLKDLGDTWMCQSTKENKTSGVPPFSGKSCAATFSQLGILRGTCWPDTCNELDINAITYILWGLILGVDEGLYGLYTDCQGPRPWTNAEIAFTTVLAFFAFLVIIGTVYELYLQELVMKKIRNKQIKVQPKVDNTYEEVNRVDQQFDIATTSVDSMEVEEIASEVKMEAAKVNGGLVDDEKPPMYSKTTLGINDFPVAPTQSSKMKNVLGWQILNGILMSFSVVNNCKKLLSAKKTRDTMAVLNGLRVLSMFWVILGHSCQFNLDNIKNPAQTFEIFSEFSFLGISNSTVSVDTFFVLSGFLVTYLTLKQIDSKKLNGAFAWAVFYFHRWWRLTPVYMAAMGIWALLMPHFGQGLFRDGFHDFIQSVCRRQWWTHPLYINNLYPWPNVLDDSCMGWAWYLANDMQFFIISPIILVILHKNGKAGMALITSLMLVSLGALFGISWHYGYSTNGQEPYNDNVPDPANADTTYSKPYTRIPTYLVGMVLGYIMFKLRGKKITIPKVVAILGWLLAFGTLFAVVYGIQSGVGRYVPQAESAIYLTFHRLAWGVGIAWIIFACLLGYGGPVAVLLEWSFWVPMARLTYCAYLIHPVLLWSQVLTDQILFHFTYVSIGYLFVGNVVFSYVSALILSLLIEGPTMGLEKVMFGKFKKA